MTKVLDYILSKFPGHSAKILDLYDKDEDFRIICDDYLTSLRALEQFRTGITSTNPFEKEFMDINHELEKELIDILNSDRKEW